jgi:hypothetical protein
VAGTLVGWLAQTSLNPRNVPTPSPQFGVAQCVTTANKGTKTLSGAALTTILGGQTGGSVRFSLVPLKFSPKQSGLHTLVLAAGTGVFGFANQ